MKVFVDTNVMLDLLAHREPFYEDAVVLFSLAYSGKITAVVAAMSYSTSSYILEKKLGHDEVSMILRQFSGLTDIASVDKMVVEDAISQNNPFEDIEDAMQHRAALIAGCDVIITRNKKDFAKSELPVYTTSEFLDFFIGEDE